MDDAYIYYTVDGIEVIDSTTEAGSRYSAMNYLENRQKREKRQEKRKIKNPLYKMICGIL